MVMFNSFHQKSAYQGPGKTEREKYKFFARHNDTKIYLILLSLCICESENPSLPKLEDKHHRKNKPVLGHIHTYTQLFEKEW